MKVNFQELAEKLAKWQEQREDRARTLLDSGAIRCLEDNRDQNGSVMLLSQDKQAYYVAPHICTCEDFRKRIRPARDMQKLAGFTQLNQCKHQIVLEMLPAKQSYRPSLFKTDSQFRDHFND